MSADVKKYLDGLYRLYNSDTVIVDTETTGLSKFDEVIDFAAVYFNPNIGTVAADFKFYPKKSISPFATKKHGYTLSILKSLGATDFIDSAEVISLLLQNNRVIAYNAVFDARMMAQTYLQRNMSIPSIQWHCAMRFYEFVYKEKIKLESACERFTVTAGKHTALSDSLATRDLLIRILNDHNYRI